MIRRTATLLFCTLLPGSIDAKELLNESVIETYLTQANPYVYTAVGQQYISQARAEAARGVFDTRLGVKYDNKRYPASEGKMTDLYVEKAIDNGVELLMGYRRAEGVQEYNNIKTGDEGEIRMGVKVPVFAVANGMNAYRYRLQSATLDAAQSSYVSKENLRHLRFDVYTAYYTLLYRRSLLELTTDLLEKAQQRSDFVRSKVDVGELPEIALLEIRRQILNREQRLLEARNDHDVALRSLLRYLGVSQEAFDTRYILPPLPEADMKAMQPDTALHDAWQNRPDIRTLQYEKSRYDLQEAHNSVSKFPRLNVALYGVHDLKYDNGFKLSLEMNFPIERRQYAGRKREIRQGMRRVDEMLKLKQIEIETALSNHLASFRTLQANLDNASAEIVLAEKLQTAETKKYLLGAGDLMRVNQRELDTLETRQKKLTYQLRLLQLKLQIDRELGTVLEQGTPATPSQDDTRQPEALPAVTP